MKKFIDKTAFICGGSKGIGKSIAKEFLRLGGNVCLLARDEASLNSAKEEFEVLRDHENQFIHIISSDATRKNEIEPEITHFIEVFGVPDYLINAVGYAYPQYVQNLSIDDFTANMETNYYGQLVPTIVFLPYLIREGKGHISFVSSMMGFMGIIGYASYAPTKFALVGLAEVLRHELSSYNITVSILYPPDTDTPGFEKENRTKPVETAALSEKAKLYSPDQVAKQYIKGLAKGKYHIMIGEALWIWRLFRFFPGLVHWVTDRDLRNARKRLSGE